MGRSFFHLNRFTFFVRTECIETQFALVNEVGESGRRPAFDKQFLIGPSFQFRPLPQMHIDLAPLFGVTHGSPRSKVFVVVGYEF